MVRNFRMLVAVTAAAASWAQVAAADDPARGERIFQRCAVCHGIGDATRPVGPNLNDVIGRVAGTLEGFDRYSANMVEAGQGGLVWTEETISEYIENPRRMIPRGTMAFPGLRNAQERSDVIAYIAQFSQAGEDEEEAGADEDSENGEEAAD